MATGRKDGKRRGVKLAEVQNPGDAASNVGNAYYQGNGNGVSGFFNVDVDNFNGGGFDGSGFFSSDGAARAKYAIAASLAARSVLVFFLLLWVRLSFFLFSSLLNLRGMVELKSWAREINETSMALDNTDQGG